MVSAFETVRRATRIEGRISARNGIGGILSNLVGENNEREFTDAVLADIEKTRSRIAAGILWILMVLYEVVFASV